MKLVSVPAAAPRAKKGSVGATSRSVTRPRRHHTPHHIERSVTVEWRYLDRQYVVDLAKATPEISVKRNASDGRLQVKADERYFPRHRTAMQNKLFAADALKSREAEKPCMIAHGGRRFRLLHRLLSAADQPGDHRERPVAPGLCSLDRGLKNRLIQTRLANFKLRRMNSDGHTTGSGIDIVASQCLLTTLIKPALGRQR